jgi:hypothetical protein
MAAPSTRQRGKSQSARTATRRGNGKQPPQLEVIKGGAAKSIQGEKHDVFDVIEEMDDAYRECRGDIHLWRTLGHWRNGGLIIKRRQCTQCTTSRTICYSERTGQLVESYYEYPEGYNIKGHGQIDRAKFRTVHFQSVTIYENEDDMLRHVMGGRKR